MNCPRCGTVWPMAAAGEHISCDACRPVGDASVVAAAAAGGELRFATVVFADMVDFTAFSEELAPDEVARVVGGLLSRLAAVVEQFHGTVEKFIGDALMATFGLPGADAAATRNAVRAGLAMQAAVAGFCQEEGLTLHIRVGIHTGEMMFCRVGRSWTVLGDAVNTASRLQHSAPPGKVWISRAVYQDVRRHFITVVRPALALKGKRRGVQPYEVVGERGTPLLEMPRFLGREAAWAQVEGAHRALLARGGLQVVIVRGKAGVGKTRLLGEVREWLERQPMSYRLDVVNYDHSERLPSHGLNALIRNRFGLVWQEVDEARVLAQLEVRLGEEHLTLAAGEARLTQELFGFVLGIMRPDFQIATLDGKNTWESVFVALKHWMEGRAARTPWVWMLEDVQKGDADTAAFVDWALRVPWAAPVMVMVTLREEDFGPTSPWYPLVRAWEDHPQVTEIRLEELPTEILAEALQTMVREAVPLAVLRQIAAHAEGNPLFATELLLLLQEQGQLQGAHLGETMVLPGTMREVLEARIERLGPTGKDVAKRGALIGRRFTRDAVARLWERGSAELDQGLTILRETETVDEEPSRLFTGEFEHVFRHGRLQEAILARIPREERLRWLARLEQWARAQLVQAGEHWEAAGSVYIPLMARALAEHEQAWESSLWYEVLALLHRKYHRTQEGLAALDQALAHASGVRRVVLYRRKVEGLEFRGDFELAFQTAALGEAVTEAPQPEVPEMVQSFFDRLLGDPLDSWQRVGLVEAKFHLALARARGLGPRGRLAEAEQTFEALAGQLAQLESPWVPRLRLRWGWGWAWALTELLARPQEAEALLAQFQRLDWSDPLLADEYPTLLLIEEHVTLRLGQNERGMRVSSERLRLAQTQGNRQGEAAAWNARGMAHHGMGELAQASQCYEQVLRLSRTIGHRRMEVVGLYNLGLVSLELGAWARAQTILEEYQARSREIGNYVGEAYGPIALSLVSMAQGQLDEAERLLQAAETAATARGWPRHQAMAQATRGALALARWPAQATMETLRGALAQMQARATVWARTDEAGEHFTTFVTLALLVGEEALASETLARAQAEMDASSLAGHAWLQMAAAILSGAPLAPALAWFQARGYVRAALVGRQFWEQVARTRGGQADGSRVGGISEGGL